MKPLENMYTVSPEQSVNEVLPLMVAQDINQVPVIKQAQLVGRLGREDILRLVEIRRGLGLEKQSA